MSAFRTPTADIEPHHVGLADRSDELKELSPDQTRIRFYQAMADIDPAGPRVVTRVCEAVARVMPDLCAIHLRVSDDKLELATAFDVNPALAPIAYQLVARGGVVPAGALARVRNASGRAAICVGRASSGDSVHGIRPHSVLIAPLRSTADVLVGTISVARHATRRGFDLTDAALLEWIAAHVSMKLETSRLQRAMARKNQELLEQARVLAEAVRARDLFIAAASHELKTPLSTLALQVALIRRELSRVPPPSRERLDVSVESMGRQVERLTHLISRLLDSAELSDGELRLQRRPVELLGLAREVVSCFGGEAARQRVQLEVHGTEVVGQWDPDRLDQVISNLVSNAVKYTTDGAVRVVVGLCDGVATRVVSDDGIGVPDDVRAQIFERFERAPNARRASGLGLGLWIARRIVDRLGGTITLDQACATGSTFRVSLPLQAPADQLSR